MAEITGIIQEIIETQRGANRMADIVVGGEKYGAGLVKFLKAKQGDYVKFTLNEDRGYKNVERNTLKVSQGKPPAEAVAAAASTQANVAKAVSGFDARQDAISRQAASNTAIAWLTLLASQDALPKATAKAKGSQQAVLDLAREEYEKLFYERNTGQEYKVIAPNAAAEDSDSDDAADEAPADAEWQ
jgi:hypothetical protein